MFRLVYVQCVCVNPGLPVLHCTCGSQRAALASCFSPLSSPGLCIKHFHLLDYLAGSILRALIRSH